MERNHLSLEAVDCHIHSVRYDLLCLSTEDLEAVSDASSRGAFHNIG